MKKEMIFNVPKRNGGWGE